MKAGQYAGVGQHNMDCRDLPQEIECFIFRQVNPPIAYNAADWGGMEWPVGGCLVCLVPSIPGRHSAWVNRNVVMAYIGTNTPNLLPGHNRMVYSTAILNRFIGFCCGRTEVITILLKDSKEVELLIQAISFHQLKSVM